MPLPGQSSCNTDNMRVPLKLAAAILLAVIAATVAVRVLVADECKESRQRMSAMSVQEITLVDQFGKMKKMTVHIADEPDSRAAGYQHICKDLIQSTAILFVYSREGRGQFHMRNVLAPLDIGFFDSQGRLRKTLLMEPYAAGKQQLYDPGVPFQYALEAREGYFAESDLIDGRARLVIRSVNDAN